jgi:hypothetical protein
MWYFNFCARSSAPYFQLHGFGPDAPRHPADDGVFRVHAIGEKEGEIGRELVHVHAPRQVILHKGEAVRQGKGQLADGIGPRLGDVVAGNRDAVEVAHAVINEVLLDVAHQPQGEFGGEDAGVLRLVFFEDVGLDRATHVGQHPLLDLFDLVVGG